MKYMMSGLLIGMVLSGLTTCGNSTGNLSLGTLSGATAGAGGYENHLKTQKEGVEQDFKDGKIDQIKCDFLLQ